MTSTGEEPEDGAPPATTSRADQPDQAPDQAASDETPDHPAVVPDPAADDVDDEDDEDDDVDDEDDEDDDEEDDEDDGLESGSERPLLPALGAVLGLTLIICIVLVAFGLPALKGGPHRVPIGLTGPTQVTAQLKTLFASGDNDAFRVREYPSEAALRTAIQDRKAYGGLVIKETSGSVAASMLVASGASPSVAQVLNSVAGELGGQVAVEDVVPLPKQDPRGTGLAAIGLPIVLAGVLPGWLLLYRRFSGHTSVALGAALAFSLASGFAVGAILRFWFHSVSGNYALISLGLALGVAAIAFPLIGLSTIAGRIGLGIGSALMVLVGYPLSGLSTAPEWFPGFWRDLGQSMPPGATATVLRSNAFFSGHGATAALVVLAAWIVGGLALVVIGTLLNPTDPYLDDDPVAEPEPTPVGASA